MGRKNVRREAGPTPANRKGRGGCTRGRSPLVGGAALRGASQRSWLARNVLCGVGGNPPAPFFPREGETEKGEIQLPCCRRLNSGYRGSSLSWLASDTGSSLGAPTARSTLQYVTMVEKPVEHGTDGGNVTEQFAPVVYGTIRSQ